MHGGVTERRSEAAGEKPTADRAAAGGCRRTGKKDWATVTMIHRARRESKSWAVAKAWVTCAALFLGSVTLLSLYGVPFEVAAGRLLGPRAGSWTPPAIRKEWHNLLVEEGGNYTATLLDALRENRTSSSPCYAQTTNRTELEGVQGRLVLPTNKVHRLTLVAFDEQGERRCAGGDYFEVDLHDEKNVAYRARPPTVDFGNGSYGLEIEVPARFAGRFTLVVWLLFRSWHGMDNPTSAAWAPQAVVLVQQVEMVVAEEVPSIRWSMLDFGADTRRLSGRAAEQRPRLCGAGDFDRTTWKGRWMSSWSNPECEADEQKRFRCLPDEHFACEEAWCTGRVGRLESNGWSYSAHCSFRLFEREEAWKCVSGRWFLFWGDSNFQDTIRNLLLFVLDWNLPSGQNLADFQLPRTFESGFINPHRLDQLFRVSQIFNGHHITDSDYEGLNTLRYPEHQALLLAHFNASRSPDTVVMNSGLHDAKGFETVEAYAEAADFAIDWWANLYQSLPPERRPHIVWRTTVAPAGLARTLPGNPNKIEMFNQVMVEKLRLASHRLPVKFIDTFDLTFPFHYSNEFSDGGHYGRAPGVNLPPWWRGPHWYFVDVMLAHIFLNALCPSAAA